MDTFPAEKPYAGTYKKYYEAIVKLSKEALKKPQYSDLKDLLPHLSQDNIDFLLDFVTKFPTFWVAAPTLFVKDRVQILTFNPGYTDANKVEHPYNIDYMGVDTLPDALEKGYYFITEALEFTQKNWHKALVEANWNSVFIVKVDSQKCLYLASNEDIEAPSDLVNFQIDPDTITFQTEVSVIGNEIAQRYIPIHFEKTG